MASTCLWERIFKECAHKFVSTPGQNVYTALVKNSAKIKVNWQSIYKGLPLALRSVKDHHLIMLWAALVVMRIAEWRSCLIDSANLVLG